MKQYIKKIKLIDDLYIAVKWRERKVSYGSENADKTFYVIRRANSKVGLFSLVMTTLGHIKYAVDKGYIPIVDLSNNSLNKQKQNVWELYFEQPCGYTLEDIAHSKNIVLSKGIIDNCISYPGGEIAHNNEELLKWKKIAEKYWILDSNIQAEAKQLIWDIFGSKKVLGVLMRGTDYVNARPPKHPVQPTVEQVINKINEVLDKYKCNYIYLVTEDEKIFQQLKELYGEKIVSLNIKRYSTQGNQNINDVRAENEKSVNLPDKQYLLSILLLAKCNYLVAGNAGGSQGALLLNQNYEYRYIFDLGIY